MNEEKCELLLNKLSWFGGLVLYTIHQSLFALENLYYAKIESDGGAPLSVFHFVLDMKPNYIKSTTEIYERFKLTSEDMKNLSSLIKDKRDMRSFEELNAIPTTFEGLIDSIHQYVKGIKIKETDNATILRLEDEFNLDEKMNQYSNLISNFDLKFVRVIGDMILVLKKELGSDTSDSIITYKKSLMHLKFIAEKYKKDINFKNYMDSVYLVEILPESNLDYFIGYYQNDHFPYMTVAKKIILSKGKSYFDTPYEDMYYDEYITGYIQQMNRYLINDHDMSQLLVREKDIISYYPLYRKINYLNEKKGFLDIKFDKTSN